MVDDRVGRGLSDLRSRRLAGVLAGVAAAAVVTVLVADHNPWRYVHLIPFGRTPVAATVLIFSSIMLGLAVRLFVGKMRVLWIVGTVATLTVFTCVAGYQIVTVESIFDEVNSDGRRTAVAVSPDGAFDLVKVYYVSWGAQYEIFRIRSRAGLTSREAAQDVACFAITIGGFTAENNFLSARFVGEHKVEVRTEAGEWTTTFDPSTLLPARTLSCGCGE